MKPTRAAPSASPMRVLDWLFGFMCLVVVCCGLVVLVTSFFALIFTNTRIERVLGSVTVSDDVPTVISRLQDIGQGALQANTIAFLFQIFTVGLIGAGTYFLQRSWKQSEEMREQLHAYAHRVAGLTPFLRGRILSSDVLRRVTHVSVVATVMASTKEENVAIALMAVVRESVGNASETLEEVARQKYGLAPIEIECIKENLEITCKQLQILGKKRLRTGTLSGIQDLFGRLAHLKAVLNNRPFGEWYDGHNEKLFQSDEN